MMAARPNRASGGAGRGLASGGRRNLCPRTQGAYLRAVRMLAEHFHTQPTGSPKSLSADGAGLGPGRFVVVALGRPEVPVVRRPAGAPGLRAGRGSTGVRHELGR